MDVCSTKVAAKLIFRIIASYVLVPHVFYMLSDKLHLECSAFCLCAEPMYQIFFSCVCITASDCIVFGKEFILLCSLTCMGMYGAEQRGVR